MFIVFTIINNEFRLEKQVIERRNCFSGRVSNERNELSIYVVGAESIRSWLLRKIR